MFICACWHVLVEAEVNLEWQHPPCFYFDRLFTGLEFTTYPSLAGRQAPEMHLFLPPSSEIKGELTHPTCFVR